ncbi:hypothetical protein [Sorangium sp. So ce1078]|uniref:hypothetical protein n=1 Tax=Sorangium sp. So ce1078 TaxID=3133329 RepID=UPI003F5DDC50
MFLIRTSNDSCWGVAAVSLTRYCASSAGVVMPPVAELAVVELVALPPPTPVVLLAEELAEVLAEELAEVLAEELAEVLAEELAEVLAEELAEVLAVLLAVELVTSAPPSPPAPPAPPTPEELLAGVPVTSPPAPDVPLVTELLVVDTADPALLELDEDAPLELEVALLPPAPPSPPRLEPSAHATSIRREAAERALVPLSQERDSPARSQQLPCIGGAPVLVDIFSREPRNHAASDVFGPSSDAHLAIGRILSTPASARPGPKVERKEVETSSLYRSPRHQQGVWAPARGLPR